MCGIFFSTKKIFNSDITEQFKLRGPDNLNIVKIDKYYFCTSLLSITGIKTIQPFIDNNIICIFNGEIYN